MPDPPAGESRGAPPPAAMDRITQLKPPSFSAFKNQESLLKGL